MYKAGSTKCPRGTLQSLLQLEDGLLSSAFGVKTSVITSLRAAITPYPLIRPLSEPVRAAQSA